MDNYIEVSPNPAALVMSMRSLGYDLNMAIADIIDNSITAKAKNIKIGFIWNGKESIIYIKDDGFGMDDDELIEAMRLGTNGPEISRHSDDLGRFGMGLKTASFSQCMKLTVITKKQGLSESIKGWDLNIVKKANKWLLFSPMLNQYEALTGSVGNHGTIIVWDDLDRSIFKEILKLSDPTKAFLESIEVLRKHIALTFNDYGTGKNSINFYINDHRIEMWNPFLSDNPHTQTKPTEEFKINGANIRITPYILPHHSHLSPEELEKAAGSRGWQDQQGFYIYRNHRLIISGTWFDQRIEKKISTKNARIKVEISNDSDELWNIDLKKSKAIPPESLRRDLKRIATFTRDESDRLYRHRGKIISREVSNTHQFVWESKIKFGKVFYTINRQHPIIKELTGLNDEKDINKLLSLVESTIPLQEIIALNQDDESKIPGFSELFTEKSLLESCKSLFEKYLKEGLKKEEIVSLMNRIQPFNMYPEIIQKIGEQYE